MAQIAALLTSLQASLLTLVIPVAVIGVILWFIAGALQPILPDWAQGMRGYFQRLMMMVAVAGGATTIVTALYGLFGGAGG
jgi:hypothetical protein